MDERIGSLLLQAHRIREYHLEEALRRQRERGGRVGTNLVEMGAITVEVLAAALSAQRNVPLATEDELQLATSEALALLPASVASQLLAIPMSVGEAGVAVAAASPWDPAVAQALAAAIGRPLLLKVAPELRIYQALETLYRLPHPRKILKARLMTPVAGMPAVLAPEPIAGLEPIVVPPALSGPFASALAPSIDVSEVEIDATADAEMELSEDMFVEESEPAAVPVAATPSPPAPLPPSPLPRVKTPLPISPVGLGDPLASMSWDLPLGGPSTSPPAAVPAPAPVPAVSAVPAPVPPPAPVLAPAPAAEGDGEEGSFDVELDEAPAAVPAAFVPAGVTPVAPPPRPPSVPSGPAVAAAPPPPRPPSSPSGPPPAVPARPSAPVAAAAPPALPRPPSAPSGAPPAVPSRPSAPSAPAAAPPLPPPPRPSAPSGPPPAVPSRPSAASAPAAAPLPPPPRPPAAPSGPGPAAAASDDADLLAPPPEPAPARSGPELATPPAPAPNEADLLAPPPEPAEELWAPPAVEMRPVTSLYMVEDAIARASRPEKVVESLLWGCEGRFEAAVFFVLDGKRARARDGFGPSGPVPFHDGFSLDLAVPSLFRAALERQGLVMEVPGSQAEAALCARMGISPKGVAVVVPFFMHGSVVTALWASCGALEPRASLAADLERLAELGASAFARLG